MTYATQQDLIDRYGDTELIQLTDENRVGAIDATTVARALADADAEMNGYLAVRYTLPLASTPLVLTRFACAIARYLLHDQAATEQVEKDYKNALAFLKSVSEGKVDLGLNAVNQSTASAGGAQYKANDRVFNADTLKDYG